MKIVVRVELTTHWGEITQVEIEKLARPACQLQADTFGLSFQDGKRLLERVQQAVVQLHACEWLLIASRLHAMSAVESSQGLSPAQARHHLRQRAC